jgi:hydroxymethylbilane synthase
MLRLGTRGSELARWQADWVAARLKENGLEVEIVEIRTSGDESTTEPIRELGAVGVFTKEIQTALLGNRIDLAVHSLKDLPTEPVNGLELAAVPVRGPYRDAVICGTFSSLDDLPEGAIVGTGSLRRRTQLLYKYRDRFRILDIRGNIGTRLRKVMQGEYDAIILAEAGLVRLGLQRHITTLLEPLVFLPAVGQGALGIEIRDNDAQTRSAVAYLYDPDTFAAVSAERAFLKRMQGGCSAPIAAYGQIIDGTLHLHGRVLSLDGRDMNEHRQSAPPDQSQELGELIAQRLLVK